ncbi:MAG: PilN domain-containing protein [Phycisphaerales bacterium]
MADASTIPKPDATRTSGRRGAAKNPAGATIAGVHIQGDAVRVVIASLESAGEPRVLQTRSFSVAEARGGAAAEFLRSLKVERVIRVIPSSRTLCRCVPVPSDIVALSDRAAAADALALVAESELSATVPPHRRAAGIISPAGHRGGADAVLCVGWPERPDDADESSLRLNSRHERWTAELVALAALAQTFGGTDAALYADRTTGAIALIMSAADPHREGANGALNGAAKTAGSRTVARVLRGEHASDAAWRASVSRALAESQRSIGAHLGDSLAPGASDQTLSFVGRAEPPRRLAPSATDPTWLNQFGVAYGAIIAATDPDPTHAALASLRLTAPKQRRGAVVGALEWCSAPRHAALVIASCLALLLIIPWLVAAGRVWILSSRSGGQEALQQRLAEADRRANFYTKLKERRWPMTKLLADVSGSAPVGVTLETLSITREQGLSIRGKSDDNDRINQFATNLSDSRVFSAVSTPTIENSSGAAEFQLEADVSSPLFPARRAIDFAAKGKTLFDRLYKTEDSLAAAPDEPAATGSAAAPAGSTPATSTPRPEDAGARSRRTDSERAAADASAERSRSRPTSAASVPEPLTDEAIAKMDANTAMLEWTSRRQWSTKSTIDDATKARLKEEAEKCKARMTEARGG